MTVRLQWLFSFLGAALSSTIHGCFFAPTSSLPPAEFLLVKSSLVLFFFLREGDIISVSAFVRFCGFATLCFCFLFKVSLPFKTTGRLTPVRLTATRRALRSTSRSLHSFIFIYQSPLISYLYG